MVTRRVASTTLAFLLILSLSPCSRDAGPQSRGTVRDSAGITIVENEGVISADAGGWAISPEPSLSTGAVEGDEEYQFFGVAGAHRMDDGRIGVVNAGSRNVRFYDQAGMFLAAYGRQGGGPEEFEAPALAGARGDTLIVVDRAHHRVSLVHPDVGFVRLARVSDEVGGFLNPSGTFRNGQSVFGGAFDMRRIDEMKNGMNRAHTYYRSCNPDGSMGVDFGDKDGAEFFIKDLEGEGRDSRPALIPFAKVPEATVSPDYFFFSSQDGYNVESFEPSGRLVRLIRKAWEPEPVTPEHGSLHIEETVAQVGVPEQATQIREYLGGLPLPDAFPAHGSLKGDLLNYLWVSDFDKPGENSRIWTVFDPEGVAVARVTFPQNFNPAEIGPDYILGVGWDDLNVEYVRMYHLERPNH
jgi:hypothetical protein